MRDWLALNDCLGAAAGPRRILRKFPDSFDAKGAQDIANEIKNRFPDKASIDRHYRILEINTAFLRREFGCLTNCRLLDPNSTPAAVTAITSVSGPPSRLRRISCSLREVGFPHSLLQGETERQRANEVVLRISSPLEEMRSTDRMVLERVLIPYRYRK